MNRIPHPSFRPESALPGSDMSDLGLLRDARNSRGRYNPLSIQLEGGGWSAASLSAGCEMKATQNRASSTVIRMKGHHGYSASGDVIAIIDFETKS
jgi:hypothetical protein